MQSASKLTIEKKPINQLTPSEKDIIINNAKNGIDNKYYDVKLFKNGNSRIVLKKNNDQNKSDKNKSDINESKVYLSNDQFLVNYIIDLNTKVNNLKNKQKKLKRKYKRMKYDIYEDIDKDEEFKQTEPDNNTIDNNTIENNLYRRTKLNWRSMIN